MHTFSKKKDKIFCDNCVFTVQSKELEAVLELAGNGISLIDTKGRFLYSNKSFQQMSGYGMEELRKESCVSLATPEYREPSQKAIDYAVKNGMIQNFKKICRTKNGEYIHAYMSLSYIKERNILVMVSADITDEHNYTVKLEHEVQQQVEAFKKQHELIQQRNKMASMGEMINAIAHQWRQPLNALGLIAQSLHHQIRAKRYSETSLLEIQRSMIEKINFLSQTIDDFYNFFKPSKKKMQFNVNDTIEEVVSLVYPQLQNNNVKLEIRSCEKAVTIFGLQNEFKHVLLNIISNAQKAILKKQKQGCIKIKTVCKNKKVIISICDNGGGIQPQKLKKMFEPYISEDGGTGIGLYMSKIIIEEHMQGSLSVTNTDEGACFEIALQGG